MIEVIREEREPVLMLCPGNVIRPEPLHAAVMLFQRGASGKRRTTVDVPMSSHTMWAMPLKQVLAAADDERARGAMREINEALRGDRSQTRRLLAEIHERVGQVLGAALGDPELRAQLREGAGIPPYRFERGTSFIVANGGFTPYATVHTNVGKTVTARTNYYFHTPEDVTVVAGDIAARVLVAMQEHGDVPSVADGSVQSLVEQLQRKRADANAILDLLVRERVAETLVKGFRGGWGEQDKPGA